MRLIRAGAIVGLAMAVAPCTLSAQQGHQAPAPPPVAPAPIPGPAALSVPHPIQPAPSTQAVPPRDLYQQLTPPVVTPPIAYPPGYGYGYGPYGYYSPFVSTSVPDMNQKTPPYPAAARGALQLDSAPGSAQVFVDGLYVGVVDDFGGRGLPLDEGAHRVELRAQGYKTLNFDVRIAAYQTTRYRGDLESATAAAPATPGVRRTMYVIPNCYAGDRPPAHPLPRGCDIARMIVRKP